MISSSLHAYVCSLAGSKSTSRPSNTSQKITALDLGIKIHKYIKEISFELELALILSSFLRFGH